MSDIQNSILSTIESWSAGRYTERHGIVSSYDPKNHLAKVTFQPEGQESGWLPIETGHIGNGYGMAFGLHPGQAGVSSSGQGGQSNVQQNQGDQVVVRYQEGDVESGKITHRVHSDMDKPPEVQSGEMVFWAKFQKSGAAAPDGADGGQGGTGQKIYFKKDGSISFEDGNGASFVLDGKGNVTVTTKNLTFNSQGDIKLKSTGKLTHNDHDIGSDHQHKDVMTGTDLSGPPK